MEVLIAVVHDGTVLAACPDVTNTLFCKGKTEYDHLGRFNSKSVILLVEMYVRKNFKYLCGCSQFHSFLCGDTVTGIENGCCRKGPEHSNVL